METTINPKLETWYHNSGQVINEQTGKTLALVSYFDEQGEEDKRVINLISKAPKLAKALKDAVKFIENSPELKDPERRPKGLLKWIDLLNELNQY